jgi:hypothetical protein
MRPVPNFSVCTTCHVHLIRFDLGLIILAILGEEHHEILHYSYNFL